LSLHRREALLALAAFSAAPAARASNDSVEVDVDASNAPELADWGRRLKAMIAGWWPVINRTLASPGYVAPDRVTIDFQDLGSPNVGAYTHGTTVTVNLPDILQHQDDFGRVAHELVHVVQAYPSPNIHWLVEGIADYLRYYVLIPNDPRRDFDPRAYNYQLGYQPAAALLDWVERSYGGGSVRRINATMRQGGDGEAELLKITGSTPFTLWRAYLKSRGLG
ncbi:MAG TPA: basic secretory protein-like protein, partial [Caulobacteraceae bacterium]|nr:basic secretory protein-like protein [Caulobacteraceae bacterium]